jgi:osmoprotectant transport system permease protein
VAQTVLLLAPIDRPAFKGAIKRLRPTNYELIGAIPVERMREANYMLDRDTDKATAAQAARFLESATGPGVK